MSDREPEQSRFQRLEDIFCDAAEMNEEERNRFLSQIRLSDGSLYQEVRELLESDGGLVQALETPVSLVLDSFPDSSLIGQTIANFRIVEEIGIGGMGTVYRATREDGEFEQTVAIKLSHRGLFSDELIRRFRTERQILAKLEHPNIVKLLDGGVTKEGFPFFVMEFVDGLPLSAFCRFNKLNVRDRLHLFMQICDAVSYAHRNLIIHRDLKPSNILVTPDGNVKLLDFGIAKILDSENWSATMTLNAPLTPAYSSPEQIRGEQAAVSSDIYTLGIVLFELLTERTPLEIYDAKPADLPHSICETDPNRPSYHTSSDSLLTGLSRGERTDLDNIILKAIRKEPELRYNSVDQLADDLSAYRDGLPVKAHPQSLSYKAAKFYRRNRVAVTVACGLILLVVFGAVVSLWQAYTARVQQKLAERRFEQVRKVANSLIFDYYDEVTKLEGSTKLREKLVADAINYLDAISDGELAEADLYKEIGVAYRKVGDAQGAVYANNLGKLDLALVSYEKSVERLAQAEALEPQNDTINAELIQSYLSVSMAYLRSNQRTRGREILTEAIKVAERMQDQSNIDNRLLLIRIKLNHTDNADTTGDLAAATRVVFKSYSDLSLQTLQLQELFPDHEPLLGLIPVLISREGFAAKILGEFSEQSGDFDSARTYYQTALERFKKNLLANQSYAARFPENVVRNRTRNFGANHYLSDTYRRLKQYDEAKYHFSLAKETLAQLQRDSDDKEAKKKSLDLLNLEQDLYFSLGQHNRALTLISEGLELAKELASSDPKNIEIVHFAAHFAQKGVKINSLLRNPTEEAKFKKLESGLEATLRTEFNYQGPMNFSF